MLKQKKMYVTRSRSHEIPRERTLSLALKMSHKLKSLTSYSSSKIKQGNLISLSYKHWHALVENFDDKRDTVRNIKVMSDVFELVNVVKF